MLLLLSRDQQWSSNHIVDCSCTNAKQNHSQTCHLLFCLRLFTPCCHYLELQQFKFCTAQTSFASKDVDPSRICPWIRRCEWRSVWVWRWIVGDGHELQDITRWLWCHWRQAVYGCWRECPAVSWSPLPLLASCAGNCPRHVVFETTTDTPISRSTPATRTSTYSRPNELSKLNWCH